MPNVKTAISLDSELFHQAERLAEELNLTRSGLYASALAEYLASHQRDLLLERINAACAEDTDQDENRALAAMRSYQSRRVLAETGEETPSSESEAE
jgi:hypothetical protein